MNIDLYKFMRESNAIEGIYRENVDTEVAATEEFLEETTLSIRSLENLVSVYQPGACLRTVPGQNVVITGARHVPPPGGMMVISQLQYLLVKVNNHQIGAYNAHCSYETIHPFMDGNGRSGRALWLWIMLKRDNPMAKLGFLHAFYYQSLEAWRT